MRQPYMSCYSTDSVSIMDYFAGLVNSCGVASHLNGVDKPSTPKQGSFREERCEHYGVDVAITCSPHDGAELCEAMSNERLRKSTQLARNVPL